MLLYPCTLWHPRLGTGKPLNFFYSVLSISVCLPCHPGFSYPSPRPPASRTASSGSSSGTSSNVLEPDPRTFWYSLRQYIMRTESSWDMDINIVELYYRGQLKSCAGIFKQSMVYRNRVGTGLSYWPARLHRLAVLIPWNWFLGSLTLSYSLAVSPDLAVFKPGFLKNVLKV